MGWTLDAWYGHLDSGRLDVWILDVWTQDVWTLDVWALGLWTPGGLDNRLAFNNYTFATKEIL